MGLSAPLVWWLSGCGTNSDDPSFQPRPIGPAVFLGATTCSSCHAEVGETYALHGHAHALTAIQGEPPDFPEIAQPSQSIEPPDGLEWEDISFLIGGYTKAANAVDSGGNLLVDDSTGDYVQYNRAHPVTGTPAGWAPFEQDQVTGQPFECFVCHTTGAERFEDNGGRRQGNRPGIGGTWAEGRVGCEACHGPGSRHIPAPEQGNITVDSSAKLCGTCHSQGDPPEQILVEEGFLLGNQQFAEVQASPHADFNCTVCHDPHRSVTYDRERAIRNECQTCHQERDLASHEGKVFTQGDYTEALACTSCHMSLASKTAISATQERTNGNGGRIGDTRTHVMWINTEPVGLTDVLGAEDGVWPTDEQGRAAITLDFICLRCHTGLGNAFPLNLAAAAGIAPNLHDTSE
ncbi:MAG: multiheme c-type cytochrome [Phycisphaerae bacterium]